MLGFINKTAPYSTHQRTPKPKHTMTRLHLWISIGRPLFTRAPEATFRHQFPANQTIKYKFKTNIFFQTCAYINKHIMGGKILQVYILFYFKKWSGFWIGPIYRCLSKWIFHDSPKKICTCWMCSFTKHLIGRICITRHEVLKFLFSKKSFINSVAF